MIEFQGQRAVFTQVAAVEDAEPLLAWLLRTPGASVDLARCTHLHPANLQVLMAAATAVCAGPEDPALAAWIQSALQHTAEAPAGAAAPPPGET